MIVDYTQNCSVERSKRVERQSLIAVVLIGACGEPSQSQQNIYGVLRQHYRLPSLFREWHR